MALSNPRKAIYVPPRSLWSYIYEFFSHQNHQTLLEEYLWLLFTKTPNKLRSRYQLHAENELGIGHTGDGEILQRLHSKRIGVHYVLYIIIEHAQTYRSFQSGPTCKSTQCLNQRSLIIRVVLRTQNFYLQRNRLTVVSADNDQVYILQ